MYRYADLRPQIFTEEAQIDFLAYRDAAQRFLRTSEAFTMGAIMGAVTATAGDSWLHMAYVDRLVELGEIREVGAHPNIAGQDRVFVKGPR